MRSCLVCDDHAMMRTAIAGAVSMAWPDTQVLLAADFDEAIRQAQEEPDLILCDLSMPGAEPLAGISAVQAAAPDAQVIVVTGREDDALLLALYELGVRGFVGKNADEDVLELAIRLVLAGSLYLPPRLLDLARQGRSSSPVPVEAAYGRLTERQVEVLRELANGRSTKEIALALRLSPGTVKTHTTAVMAALGVANRTEAAIKARELGLI
jgi:two-component system, NarL family, nitrate/nitrite response regulator NarL